MFLQTTAVLLLFMGCLLAAENSTTTETLQPQTDSTAPSNRTTRTADSSKSVKNFVTKILAASSNPSKLSHPSTEPPKKNHETHPFHGPDGNPEYISHDTIHHAEIIYEEPSTEIIYQDPGNNYYEEPKPDSLHQQDIHQAIIDKEEFIQSEIHDLAHHIVETEYKKPEKPKGKPHPTSWKSLFSNIFPQGILNVFHLSVSGALKEMKKEHVTYHTHTYATSPSNHYLSRSNRMASELATLPITTPIESTPKLLDTPPLPEPSPMPPAEQAIILESPTTQKIEQNQNATVMTNKDVYDINMAAEVSQIPVEVIPMESNNVFRIHAVNCDEKCNEESEDYIDEPLSEAGDDNAVAFSQEAPRNIFYPTPKSLPYDSNNYYFGTGTRTSEEIIQENNQKFGQKIIYHPAKQLDDFQKEVEKQFDHNEVKIDAEANSRKFLKNFKGKYVRPQESDSVQSTTFKGLNHYQLVASTLRPEVTFVGQPSPVKPEGQMHTYIFSAGFNSDKARESESSSRYGKSENGAQDETNLFQPYSKAKPESLLHTYIFSSQDNNSVSETPSASTWQPSNSNSDTKDNSNQLYSNTYSSTAIYESSKSPDVIPEKDSNENTVQPYSTNLKPESLLHTYIFAGSDNNKNNYSFSSSDSSGNPKSEGVAFAWTPSTSTPATPTDIIEIQKSIEVKHTKPYVYYNYPPNQPQLLSKNPIRVAQAEDSQQSESHLMPESYQQRQQYLQDLQKQLNQQQEYYQQQLIEQYQQKLHLQQQEQYLQNQRKHEEQLREYQQKQQEQLQQYQQRQKYQQQQEYQQQIQQQQQNQQSQYYQQQQGYPKQSQYYQQENQQQQKEKNEKPQNYVRYNTVKVEKVVPKPYPVPVKEVVEKIIEKPVHVEHIVEKPVNVPYPVREVVEKIVDRPYPVEKIIDRPVHIPYPVQVDHFIDRPYAVRVPVPVAVPVPVHQYIDRPYPVEKIVEKPIHVPYPVDKIVEKIVEKHIPVEVEKYIEKPAPAAPSKRLHPPLKKSSKSVVHTVVKTKAALNSGGAVVNNSKIYEDELLELVPPPIDQADHDDYKTLPDDVQFVLIDDYNGPVPFDNQGYPWNTQEKRATKNHNTKRSPEFRRNLRVEYGFRPPLIPSVEIGEKGLI